MNDAPAVTQTPVPRKRRPNATFEEKIEWAKRFAASQLKMREFCRQHGLVLTTLQRWLAQARRYRQQSSDTKADFVEVKVSPPVRGERWAAELYCSSGRVLRLAHDIPTELLQQLLRAC